MKAGRKDAWWWFALGVGALITFLSIGLHEHLFGASKAVDEVALSAMFFCFGATVAADGAPSLDRVRKWLTRADPDLSYLVCPHCGHLTSGTARLVHGHAQASDALAVVSQTVGERTGASTAGTPLASGPWVTMIACSVCRGVLGVIPHCGSPPRVTAMPNRHILSEGEGDDVVPGAN